MARLESKSISVLPEMEHGCQNTTSPPEIHKTKQTDHSLSGLFVFHQPSC